MNREQRRSYFRCDSLPSIAQWRTNYDDMADQVRTIASESASHQSTQAVADDNNPASSILRNFFQTPQHALNLALRASDIEVDSRDVSAITDFLQPSRHRTEGPVA